MILGVPPVLFHRADDTAFERTERAAALQDQNGFPGQDSKIGKRIRQYREGFANIGVFPDQRLDGTGFLGWASG